jgi:hypothetical protein
MRLRAVSALLLALTCACTTDYTWRPARLPGAQAAPTPDPRGLASGVRPTVEQARWAHLFVFGLIGQGSVDLRDVCPGPVAERLRTGMTLPTTLVAVITLGVYTPLEHRFTCIVPPPGPLHIPRVTLEETAPLQREEEEGFPDEGQQFAGERRAEEDDFGEVSSGDEAVPPDETVPADATSEPVLETLRDDREAPAEATP